MQTYCNIRNCNLCRKKVSLQVLTYYNKNGERKCSENELYCMAHAMELAAKDFDNLTISYASFAEKERDKTENKEVDEKVIPIPDKEVYDTVGECAG